MFLGSNFTLFLHICSTDIVFFLNKKLPEIVFSAVILSKFTKKLSVGSFVVKLTVRMNLI